MNKRLKLILRRFRILAALLVLSVSGYCAYRTAQDQWPTRPGYCENSRANAENLFLRWEYLNASNPVPESPKADVDPLEEIQSNLADEPKSREFPDTPDGIIQRAKAERDSLPRAVVIKQALEAKRNADKCFRDRDAYAGRLAGFIVQLAIILLAPLIGFLIAIPIIIRIGRWLFAVDQTGA
jgi:hypothetical protein